MERLFELCGDLVRPARAMEVVNLICRHDRYQASDGIVAAATDLARLLRNRGLPDPWLCMMDPGPGRIWNFSLPPSWAPQRAELRLGDGTAVSLSKHPLLLAVNSAALGPRTFRVRTYDPGNWAAGSAAIALVRGPDLDADKLESDGVQVFAAVAPAVSLGGTDDLRGRIELPYGTPLTGFSLDRRLFDRLSQIADRSGTVTATVEIETSSPLPLLSWELPGGLPGEIWLMAHLCHQRPGANDNASGVAGLVEATSCLRSLEPQLPFAQRRTIRFFTGPEFIGIAGFLRRIADGAAPGSAPAAVINLDMIGQDCGQCGGLFRIERCPSAHRSDLAAVAERAVDACFGSKGLEWAPMSFHGYSDNSVFAAGPFACPTIQLCHDGDAFNHTSGDLPARLAPGKLASAAAAAAATAAILSLDTEDSLSWRRQARRDWLSREIQRAEAMARDAADRGFRAWAAAFCTDRLREFGGTDASCQNGDPGPEAAGSNPLSSSPLNLRGLLAHLPEAARREYSQRLASNKQVYAVLLNAIVAAAGGKEAPAATDAASCALGLPLDPDLRSFVSAAVEQMSRAGAP